MQVGITKFRKPFRHANRYLEILKVLIKYGFADIISRSGLEKAFKLSRKVVFRKTDPTISSLSRWVRVRMVFEELGPTFIKFGQLLSIRGDLIPLELAEELERLQDDVPPFPGEDALELVEKELKQTRDDLFAEFTMKPSAAGSLAQVHRAVLRSGEDVAVKIQRPDIQKQIRTDLEILQYLASMATRHIPELKTYSLQKIVDEFSRTIERELNFLYEASNMETFNTYYADEEEIHVPVCYRDLSSRKVLTMEHVEGIKVSNIGRLTDEGYDLSLIAQRGVDVVLRQIFEVGFFHADPHPGNLLVLEDNRLCFLDYGMMGKLSPSTKRIITSMLMGAVLKDSEFIMRNLLRLCDAQGEVNHRDLESSIADIIDQFFFTSLDRIDVASLIASIVNIFPRNHLIMPADMYLLARTITLLQANGERLDPQFNVAQYIKPHVMKLYRSRIKVSQLSKDFVVTIEEFAELMRIMPFEVRDILDKIKRGKIHIQFEHTGLDPLKHSFERTYNRISFSLIVAALLIGSSLIISSGTQPLVYGIPIIGVVGFLAAGFFGFWLLFSILRHGKL